MKPEDLLVERVLVFILSGRKPDGAEVRERTCRRLPWQVRLT